MSTSQSRAGLTLRLVTLLVSLSMLNPLAQAIPVHTSTHAGHKVETAHHHESAPHPLNFHPIEGLPGFPKLHETIPVFHAPGAQNLVTLKPGAQLHPNVIRFKPIKMMPAIARREFLDDTEMYY